MENLPRHVAIIMDGNGRWAKKRGLIRSMGHDNGAKVVSTITTECSNLGIEQLTLYAFSTENWKRPKAEVAFLMKLLKNFVKNETPNMMQNNIIFRPIGRLYEFPQGVQDTLNETVEMTKNNTGTTLSLALNYSGRSEITDTFKKLAYQVSNGQLSPEAIDEDLINNNLFTAGMPELDLMIRTAGELRLSNYLLWQVSYAELWVTDVLWPDFTVDIFYKALEAYSKRERRFGGLV